MSDVNLIPPNRLASKLRRARLRTWGTICVVYVASLTIVLSSARTFWSGSARSVEAELANTQQQIDQHNEAMIDLRRQLAEAMGELEVNRATTIGPDWSKLVVMLAEQLGEEIVLNRLGLVALDQQNNQIAENIQDWLSSSPTGLPDVNRQYTIRLAGFGRTQSSVSHLLLRLEKVDLFQSVRLVNSYRQAFLGDHAVAFTIECRI